MRKAFYIGYKGRLEAYIYIWFSKQYRFVYVGETNNINGVIGRACQHVTRGQGTLYSRVDDEGYDIQEINDFVLLSYPLPRQKKFMTEESAYRISVEYLVQKKLYALRREVDRPYKMLSSVTTGPCTGMKSIDHIADKIAYDFVDIYQNE